LDQAGTGAVVERVMPQVPARASATIHGTVKVAVRVAVDASGNVSSATLEAPGPSHYFANLALEASQHWRFKPAAVPSAWILHYAFRQGGVEVTPAAGS
jgi:TonB family protein